MPEATRKVLVPCICLPFLSISAQLELILSAPGVEGDVDWWRNLPRHNGYYRNISDGRVWSEILDPEGKRFFRSATMGSKKCGPDGELRIGIALAMDWCVIYFALLAPTNAIIGSVLGNLTRKIYRRFRVSNLILMSIFPGPKEQTCDQVQRCL